MSSYPYTLGHSQLRELGNSMYPPYEWNPDMLTRLDSYVRYRLPNRDPLVTCPRFQKTMKTYCCCIGLSDFPRPVGPLPFHVYFCYLTSIAETFGLLEISGVDQFISILGLFDTTYGSNLS